MFFCRNDRADDNRISEFLGGRPVTVVDCTASTNTDLWALGAAGAPDGAVYIARRQTGGRGRLGRSFLSEDGGLYLSLLLRPKLKAEDCCLITPIAALAVAEAIERHTDKKADIKWVNDVYCDGKKVCGILTEASIRPADGGVDFVVVGVGLNVYAPKGGFPAELADIAGALLPYTADGKELISRLAADIAKGISAYAKHPHSEELVERYRRRCFIVGTAVDVYRGAERYTANAVDIDGRYGLVVDTADGARRVLTSGEVSVRKAGGCL